MTGVFLSPAPIGQSNKLLGKLLVELATAIRPSAFRHPSSKWKAILDVGGRHTRVALPGHEPT